MGKYVEFRKELETNKTGRRACVIPISELVENVDPYVDCYRSLFYYDEEILKHVTEKKTVSGFRGKAGADILVWDFDNKDLTQAKEDALSLINKLNDEYDIDDSEIGVFFSGRKGFAIEVRTSGILGLDGVLDENIPLYVKKLCTKLAGDLESFDGVIYNHNRLYRISGTLHQKESDLNGCLVRLFKMSLPMTFFRQSSVEEIRTYAQQVHLPETVATIKSPEKLSKELSHIIKHIDTISKELPRVQANSEGIADENSAPSRVKTCIWRICQGSYTEGRDNALLRVADHERKQGSPPEVIKGKLQGVLALMNQNDPQKAQIDPITDYDLDRIVRQSMNNDYDYGCFDPVLDSLCSKKCHLASKKFKESNVETVTLADAYRRSTPFYKKYYENIVPTGFRTLDLNMPLFRGTFNLIVGKPGCHEKGTEILMFDGSVKKVEDVETRDLLMGPDSSPRTVLDLCRAKQEMVKIIPTKGAPFTVNLDHILSLRYSNYNGRNGIKNISVRDYLALSKTEQTKLKLYRTGVEFNSDFYKDLEIDPYILGIWLGDGASRSNLIYTMDKEVVSAMTDYANSVDLEVRISESQSKNSGLAKCYVIGSKTSKRDTNEFLQSLRKLELLGNKHIPNHYLVSSRSDRLNLLSGLLDSDGHKTNSCFEFVSKWKHLTDSVLFLSRSLGFSAYVVEKVVNGTVYYRMCISGDTEEIPVRIERKKCPKRQQIKNVLHTGFTTELLPVDNYYGFCLDKDHLYVMGDFTVTHNTGKTSLMLNIMKHASSNGIPALFFSLDMSEAMLVQRCAPILLSTENDPAKMSGKDFMQAHARDDIELMEQAAEAFDKLGDNVKITSNRGLTVEDIRAEIERQESILGNEIKLVIVDYVQLLKSDKDGFANHEYNAESITALAKEKNICILGLSQATGEKNDADILAKGSRAWEEQVSTQINCFRPFERHNQEYDFIMSIRMAKNRLGGTGTIDLFFHGPTGFSRDLHEGEQLELEALRDRIEHEK